MILLNGHDPLVNRCVGCQQGQPNKLFIFMVVPLCITMQGFQLLKQQLAVIGTRRAVSYPLQ